MGKDPHDFEEVLSVRTQAMRHTNIIQAALAAMTHMTLDGGMFDVTRAGLQEGQGLHHGHGDVGR